LFRCFVILASLFLSSDFTTLASGPNFGEHYNDPVDKVRLEEFPKRYTAFNFLFPDERKPQFGNDRVAVTRAAADKVAGVFNSIVSRGEDRERAQRFILQCVMALFSEDFGLLPKGLFTELIYDCREGGSSYDLFGALFQQMNNPKAAHGGRFKDVQYFNGGLFSVIEPIDLTLDEVELLYAASMEDWGKVQPPIFGTLFQSSMGSKERHAAGAHFTSEADIQRVVLPTIVKPWQERIKKAESLKDLLALLNELIDFRVLDPACGSGNFLYVAYRELKRVEMDILTKIHENFKERSRAIVGTTSLVSIHQFYGIDSNPFAVELAKVTLMLAKELAINETQSLINAIQPDLPLHFDKALPLDNLDANIRCDDALFCEWPKVQAIIGNPPYQSKNKMQQEYGPAYVSRLRTLFKNGIPGRADYCVYWFRRAQDELPKGGRAGLVGTNTIRQNYSREGGLDYIVQQGSTITEAVSSQVWSGDAVVHVSIVNWIKGEQGGKKKLYKQLGDNRHSPWQVIEVDKINSALSATLDVTDAKRLNINMNSGMCYQGQTHGHEAFLLTPSEASMMISKAQKNAEVIFPYLTADNLLTYNPPLPQRYAIDFHPRDVFGASKYAAPFSRIKENVLPVREEMAREEKRRNEEVLKANPKARVNHHHRNFLERWWLFSYPRPELIEKITALNRYIACGQVTKRPIFEFINPLIRPNAALVVFAVPDDYSFGILQSDTHWAWFVTRCSTLKGDFRYTSDTVFDTFPWPQSPTLTQVKKIADAAVALRALRRKIMEGNNWSLRDLYRTLDLPGKNPLKDAQDALDTAVRNAYGMKAKDDPLSFLLKLNQQMAKREEEGLPVIGPGLPPDVKNPESFITDDCMQMTS
jgi:SAM-dependent methyltransferase